MPIKIIRTDITRLACDAIVNPSNEALIPGGGTDAAIHKAAGEELLAACRALGGVKVGEAKLTAAFRLPARFVIHTAGPVWQGGSKGEEQKLCSSYASALALAHAHGCESVAFPLISSGTCGFPKDRVLKLALRCIEDFLFTHEMFVYLVVFDKTSYALSERLFASVSSFIDDAYAEADKKCFDLNLEARRTPPSRAVFASHSFVLESVSPEKTLGDMLARMDKGFAETLFTFIDQKGLTDVEC